MKREIVLLTILLLFLEYSQQYLYDYAYSDYEIPMHGYYDTRRIIGGNYATVGEIPWQVSLVIHTNKPSPGVCGGALIHPLWVLTAKHCLKNYTSVSLRFGAIHKSKGLYRYTKEVYFYQYTDLAIVKLKEPVPIDDSIMPIRLPNKKNHCPARLVGDTIRISGFGRTKNRGGMQPYLKFVDVEVLNTKQCRTLYGRKKLCIFNGKRETHCFGDSGGPMAYEECPGDWVLVGIVIAVSNKGCDSAPSVGVSLVFFLDWIHEITGIPVK